MTARSRRHRRAVRSGDGRCAELRREKKHYTGLLSRGVKRAFSGPGTNCGGGEGFGALTRYLAEHALIPESIFQGDRFEQRPHIIPSPLHPSGDDWSLDMARWWARRPPPYARRAPYYLETLRWLRREAVAYLGQHGRPSDYLAKAVTTQRDCLAAARQEDYDNFRRRQAWVAEGDALRLRASKAVDPGPAPSPESPVVAPKRGAEVWRRYRAAAKARKANDARRRVAALWWYAEKWVETGMSGGRPAGPRTWWTRRTEYALRKRGRDVTAVPRGGSDV